MEWTQGKERNIRTLISSLHTVLWEDENRWKQVGMHQLVSANEVKTIYTLVDPWEGDLDLDLDLELDFIVGFFFANLKSTEYTVFYKSVVYSR